MEKFQLLIRSKQEYLLSRSGYVDEAVDVDIDKGGHEELAVKPVHDTPMSRYQVTKILDLECPLESRSKETTKRTNDGCKEGHEEAMNEERINCEGSFHSQNPTPGSHGVREAILLGSEQG